MVFWLGLPGADKTGKGHSGMEGRLLLGHAGSGSGVTGDGRQIVRRPARMRQPIRGSGRPRSSVVGQCAAARRWG